MKEGKLANNVSPTLYSDMESVTFIPNTVARLTQVFSGITSTGIINIPCISRSGLTAAAFSPTDTWIRITSCITKKGYIVTPCQIYVS